MLRDENSGIDSVKKNEEAIIAKVRIGDTSSRRRCGMGLKDLGCHQTAIYDLVSGYVVAHFIILYYILYNAFRMFQCACYISQFLNSEYKMIECKNNPKSVS